MSKPATKRKPPDTRIAVKAKLPERIYRDMYRLDDLVTVLSMSRKRIDAIVAGRSDLPILPTIQDGRFKFVSRTLLDEWLAKLEQRARGMAS